MPRRTSVQSKPLAKDDGIGARKSAKDDEWGGYVQCSLGEAERERYDLWLAENPRAADMWLVDDLASGLKLSLVWDNSNQCFIATYTGRPDNAGDVAFTCSLSARGATLPETLAVLVYKHHDVMGGDWTDWLVNGAKTKRNFG